MRPRKVMMRSPSGLRTLNEIVVPSFFPAAILTGFESRPLCWMVPVNAEPFGVRLNTHGPFATWVVCHRPAGPVAAVGGGGAAGAGLRPLSNLAVKWVAP